MHPKIELSFPTLLLMISFASVNAVLFTPALPNIAHFFSISDDKAQLTIIVFLIGYALGQLLYGPFANRYGRKPALYIGVCMQIVSSLLCVLSGLIHDYSLLIVGRFLLALGSGVGLKMTYTLVNECYPIRVASQKISYLMLAFAVTPGLAVALGGILNTQWGWMSCFYASAIYGLILLAFITRLPETLTTPHEDALQVNRMLYQYGVQFKNNRLMACAFMMGMATAFIYVFAAFVPFLAIDLMGMSSEQYGFANILPPLGLIAGSLYSAALVKEYPLPLIIRRGIVIASIGVLFMMTTLFMHLSPIISLFLPMIIIYFGLALIPANASTIAMSTAEDKAHGSAVMSFVNMGLATLIVATIGLFPLNTLSLPILYIGLCIVMLGIDQWIMKKIHAS